MELNRLFIKYRIPEQVIYSGDNKIELFRIKKGIPEKISSYEREKGDKFFPLEIKNDLINTNTGLKTGDAVEVEVRGRRIKAQIVAAHMKATESKTCEPLIYI